MAGLSRRDLMVAAAGDDDPHPDFRNRSGHSRNHNRGAQERAGRT